MGPKNGAGAIGALGEFCYLLIRKRIGLERRPFGQGHPTSGIGQGRQTGLAGSPAYQHKLASRDAALAAANGQIARLSRVQRRRAPELS